jgi:hypothetical protein
MNSISGKTGLSVGIPFIELEARTDVSMGLNLLPMPFDAESAILVWVMA